MMDGLIPTGLMRNSPEQVYALTAFATVVLLKCLRPEFSPKLDRIQEDRIIKLVKRLLITLTSDQEASGDTDQHTTRRYARFLQHILGPHIAELEARRKNPPANVDQDRLPEVATASSSSSALPPVKMSPPPEDLLPPMEFGMPLGPEDWAPMFSNQDATPIPPILGFSDSDYLAAMMSFSDQSWFC